MEDEIVKFEDVRCTSLTRITLKKRYFDDFGQTIVPSFYVEIKQGGNIIHLEKCHLHSIVKMLGTSTVDSFVEIIGINGNEP